MAEDQPDQTRIVIDVNDEPVWAGQFGEFLQLFERMYLATRDQAGLLQFMEYWDPSQLSSAPLAENLGNIWETLPSASSGRLRSYKDGRGLPLVRFSRRSPIELIIASVPIACMAAVIFSGGHVRMPGFEFRLPPLGTGIKSLRQALRPAGPREKPQLDSNIVRSE
jgi:hypothetical protein